MIFGLRLNDNLEEDVTHPVEGFPHMFDCDEVARQPGGFVPWHWHADVEFMWILDSRS